MSPEILSQVAEELTRLFMRQVVALERIADVLERKAADFDEAEEEERSDTIECPE